MAKLNEVIDKFVENFKAESIEDEKIKSELKEYLYIQITDEVINSKKDEIEEYTNKKEAEMIQNANKKIQKESLRQKIKDSRELLVSGTVIAFFMGMAVNQFTEFVSILVNENMKIYFSIGLGVLFLLICFVTYKWFFRDKVTDWINRFIDEDENGDIK